MPGIDTYDDGGFLDPYNAGEIGIDPSFINPSPASGWVDHLPFNTVFLTAIGYAVLTPTASLASSIIHYSTLTGVEQPTGSLSSSYMPAGSANTYTKAVSGSLSFVGVKSIIVSVLKTATITPHSATTNKITKAFTASTTPSGTINKKTTTSRTGALTFSGTQIRTIFTTRIISTSSILTTRHTIAIASTANFMPTSTQQRSISHKTIASITPTGHNTSRTTHSFTATERPTGAFVAGTLHKQSTSGSINPTGTLVTIVSYGKILTINQSSSISTGRMTLRSIVLSSALTFVGSKSMQTLHNSTASIHPSSSQSRLISKKQAAILQPAGTLISSKQYHKLLSGTLQPAGIVVENKVFLKSFSAVLTLSVSFDTPDTQHNLHISTSSTASVLKSIGKPLDILGGSTISMITQKDLTSSLTPSSTSVGTLDIVATYKKSTGTANSGLASLSMNVIRAMNLSISSGSDINLLQGEAFFFKTILHQPSILVVKVELTPAPRVPTLISRQSGLEAWRYVCNFNSGTPGTSRGGAIMGDSLMGGTPTYPNDIGQWLAPILAGLPNATQAPKLFSVYTYQVNTTYLEYQLQLSQADYIHLKQLYSIYLKQPLTSEFHLIENDSYKNRSQVILNTTVLNTLFDEVTTILAGGDPYPFTSYLTIATLASAEQMGNTGFAMGSPESDWGGSGR